MASAFSRSRWARVISCCCSWSLKEKFAKKWIMSTFIHFLVVLFDVLLRSTKKRKFFLRIPWQILFSYFMSSLFEAVQYLCVRNKSKLFIALYIGMHNISTTFQLSNDVIVLDFVFIIISVNVGYVSVDIGCLIAHAYFPYFYM